MAGYLHPQDIIGFFVDNGGRITNNELVRHFGPVIQSEHAQTNKMILKKVTGHIATVRRQGTLSKGGEASEGGKLIVMRKKFSHKSTIDIWSSLLLSLPQEEIDFLVPNLKPIKPRQVGHESSYDDTTAEDQVEMKENIEADISRLGTSLERGGRQGIYFPEQENITLERLEASTLSENETEDRGPDNQDLSEKHGDRILSSKMKSGTSVRDLKKTFDGLASTSNISLLDHLNTKQGESLGKQRRGGRPPSMESLSPNLSAEARAWINAALRFDYNTMAKLASTNPSLVTARDPANGYTALHWAARKGQSDLVKLLVGTYRLNPDLKSRGGYTPLMMAGMGKQHEVYNLLVDTYQADEDIRDFSGHTASYYLENHLQVPGFPPTMDLSHDRESSVDVPDSSARLRKRVARHSRQHFIRGIKDSLAGGIRTSLRDSFGPDSMLDSLRGNIRISNRQRPKSSSSVNGDE